MKKKLLPYILGCSLMAVVPFAAHAEDTANTYFHTGNDIESSGTTTNYADWNADSQAQPDLTNDESHNEFTEYNSVVDETNGTQNKRSMTFGTPSISNGAVTWTARNDGLLGNTRNTTAATQGDYPVAMKNEAQDTTYGTLAQNIASSDFQANDNDYFWGETEQDYVDKNDTAVTDLETAVPEFTMTIPAKTVLPMGATHWRLGNVKINGQYFVRPDKVDVVVTHDDFKHSTYDAEQSADHRNARTIAFTVSDKRYDNTSIESAHRYFFQNGDGHMQTAFPYAYTEYSSDRYEDGYVTDINETHQVWLNTANGAWTGKIAGKYTGSITFNAEVTATEAASMYEDGNYYPAEGEEEEPTP